MAARSMRACGDPRWASKKIPPRAAPMSPSSAPWHRSKILAGRTIAFRSSKASRWGAEAKSKRRRVRAEASCPLSALVAPRPTSQAAKSRCRRPRSCHRPVESAHMRGRDAKLHHPDLGRSDRPRCDAWAMACLVQVATGGVQSHRGHLGAFKMPILIVGIGALGGTIAARALRAGLPVRLAARNTESAEVLRRSGLRVSGIGGVVRADAIDVAAIEDYGKGDQFDLILLATKAQDTLEVAPRVLRLLAPGGVMLPIQNGGVARGVGGGPGGDNIL